MVRSGFYCVFQDQSTYSHWLIESVQRRSGDRCAGAFFDGLIVAMTREEAAADGLDVDSTGFHLPTPAVDAAARVEMAAAGLDAGVASSDEEVEESDAESDAENHAESDAESDVGSDSGGVLDCDDDAQPVDLNEIQRK